MVAEDNLALTLGSLVKIYLGTFRLIEENIFQSWR